MISELMQLDLPAPVAPAMSRCGMVARFTLNGRPAMSRPEADLERVGGRLGALLGDEDVAQGHELALPVGDLDADGAAARGSGR